MRCTVIALAVASCALAACAGDPQIYRRTVPEAAVHRPTTARPLTPLTYPVEGATLTRSAAWAKDKIGQDLVLTRDSWITIEPQVRDVCKTYPPTEQVARLHKLLGLKPAEAADAGSVFVLMTVAAPQSVGPAGTAVFRPCPDPDPTRTSCGNELAGPPAYADWFARTVLSSYVLADDMGGNGYPWTRAGYTFDWNSGADPRQGPQEYVVAKGSTVRIRAIIPVDAYCR